MSHHNPTMGRETRKTPWGLPKCQSNIFASVFIDISFIQQLLISLDINKSPRVTIVFILKFYKYRNHFLSVLGLKRQSIGLFVIARWFNVDMLLLCADDTEFLFYSILMFLQTLLAVVMLSTMAWLYKKTGPIVSKLLDDYAQVHSQLLCMFILIFQYIMYIQYTLYSRITVLYVLYSRITILYLRNIELFCVYIDVIIYIYCVIQCDFCVHFHWLLTVIY